MVYWQNVWEDPNIVKVLQAGGVVVMPTDTIYGIVGRALDSGVVERIYKIRKRSSDKPCIILIGDIRELEKFSTILSPEQENAIKNFRVPTSFIVDCSESKFTYLHRGANSLAFRLPLQKELRELLLKTGPLIAPSANTEALPPVQNIMEARKYFGDSVDLYIDGGELKGQASKVIKLHKDGSEYIIRA